MDIAETKAALRKSIRAARRDLSEEERASAAEKVKDGLLSLDELLNADCVLAYMPMKYELDVLPAVKALETMGKRAAFPLCTDNGGLRFFIPSKENGFVKGAYGIDEPNTETAIEIGTDDIDAIILPAVGFDRDLNRLGQGGGYYDRLLSGTDCFKAAVGFDCQLVERVPTEDTDMPVDAVVTPSCVLRRR